MSVDTVKQLEAEAASQCVCVCCFLACANVLTGILVAADRY